MNLKPSKLSGARVLQLSEQFRKDAYLLDLDRAELSRHYNGGPLVPDDPQAGRPSLRRPNMLLGFKFLDRPMMQLLSTYDEGVGLLEGTLYNDELQPSRRRVVEEILNREINQVVQKSERLYYPFKAMVGDSVINGIGVLYRDSPYDWCPKYGRPYFSWDASADITSDKFADWCFLGSLSLGEIIARLDRIKSTKDEDSYWDRARLSAVAEAIARRNDPEKGQGTFQPLNYDDPIAWREWVQAQTWGASAMSSSCPVVWFFSKRFDKGNKRPVDLYCVPRWGEVESTFEDKLEITRDTTSPHQGALFYQPEAFDDVLDCFFPFLISCMIGGEPLMRRVMGLGALMYDLDVRVQLAICNMFDASDFDFSPLFQAQDAQSEAELQELAAVGIRSYDILPAGARFMDKPKGSRPYSSVFELTQLMSSEMGNQAQSFHGGEQFENKGRAELEVQVLERRQQLTTALRLRMGDFIRRADPMCEAIGEVLVNADLLKCDRAWPEREELKKRLKECGVEWSEVSGKATFAMRRSPGHGDPSLALARAQQTEVIARGLGPKAHRIAQRNLVSQVNGGDTKLALELVPEQDSEKAQETEAILQSAACLNTFIPVPVKETDNPMAHVPIHMMILQSHLANGTETGTWTRGEQRGWEALAAHTIADVRILGSFDPQNGKAAEQQIHQMVGKANGIQISGPVDPVEQMKLKLAMQEQERKQVKTADDIQHRKITQEHREESSGFQENLQLAQQSNTERDSAVTRATKITKAAREMIEEPATT